MLILLDHSAPRPIRRHLTGHTVHTVAQLGWELLSDGQVLTLAEEAGYELLITSDTRIYHQQNLSGRNLAILVFAVNNWTLIRQHIDTINAAIGEMQPGAYIEIEIPLPPLSEYTGR